MSSPLEEIGSQIDSQCVARIVNKQGCSVELAEAPHPRLVIDLDHPASPTKSSAVKCDYLFFARRGRAGLWVVPLELKSSGVNPNTVSRQLQAGAKVAERLAKGSFPIQFVPVVARGNKGHRRQYKELAKKRIVFRKGRYPIELMDCGASLHLDGT